MRTRCQFVTLRKIAEGTGMRQFAHARNVPRGGIQDRRTRQQTGGVLTQGPAACATVSALTGRQRKHTGRSSLRFSIKQSVTCLSAGQHVAAAMGHRKCEC